MGSVSQAAYLQADPTEPRLFNQAFFERIEIDTEQIAGHKLTAPYAQLAPLVNALPAGPKPTKGHRAAAASNHRSVLLSSRKFLRTRSLNRT